jgi:hypothetical protein
MDCEAAIEGLDDYLFGIEPLFHALMCSIADTVSAIDRESDNEHNEQEEK